MTILFVILLFLLHLKNISVIETRLPLRLRKLIRKLSKTHTQLLLPKKFIIEKIPSL